MANHPALLRGTFSKFDEDARLCFGWASVVAEKGADVVDLDKETIDMASLESAAYDFMLSVRVAGEMHKELGIGRVCESVVVTKEKLTAMGIEADREGWWIGVRVDDEAVWKKVRSGEYGMFSIGGIAEVEEVAA